MSVVAARVAENKIQMAADAILVKGYSKRNTNFAKIAEINDMIVGGVGTAQEISLMWHYMRTHKPTSASEKDVLEFVIEFSRWKKDMTGRSDVENYYLLAYQGHLFEIEDMFVFEINDYTAIGAGENFANAALCLGHSPKEAVEVACKLSCYVCEPILEYEMDRPTKS